VVIQPTQEIAHERRFPAANFPGDHGKAGAVHYAKLEHGECQSVILAPVD
jgi:hypothetical protein